MNNKLIYDYAHGYLRLRCVKYARIREKAGKRKPVLWHILRSVDFGRFSKGITLSHIRLMLRI